MKKYNKPTVNVVSMNSSESIAKLTFDGIKGDLIRNELYAKKYTVSTYTITSSVVKAGKES